MSDTPPNTPVPPSPQPPAPPPAAPPAPAPPPRYVEPTQRSAPDLERELADTRAEAAARRVDARTAREEADRAREEAARIRQEADARVAAAEAAGNQRAERFRQKAIDAELRAAAANAGLVDLDLLPLISREGVAADDDGNVAGVAEAVERFRAAKPTYFRGAEPGPTPGPRQPVSSGPRAPVPTPAPGGPTPPPSVRDIPRTREGRAEYEAKKREALRELRRA